ncbi:carbamoyltransferase family protein [Achromobacter aloeverae]|uniref:Carbamoyltransferase n=1 Tax=Achromobacter aloeverae TaxID=1750518 RepID=A0A4Q1HGF1_9BURK|nr:carbamoyltransferase C-terminal domain-containing protein [Achromobacter aloeverae]RXN86172.1 carbamoyltransferase [Achromobacter aloeverae]
MYTLGINAAFHDCSAALVQDGILLAASEEERYTHVKHGKRPVPFSTWQLPYHAIDDCLARAGITLAQVDRYAYAFDPRLLVPGGRLPDSMTLPLEPSAAPRVDPGHSPWEALFLSYIANAPRQLVDGVPHHLRARWRDATHAQVRAGWRFVEHHAAHEASAYLASPFQETAVLSLDGRGERVTTSHGVFRDGIFQRLKQVEMPHSLGLLYEDFTQYLGFLRSSDEYKVMALASYGQPTFRDALRDIVRTDNDGGYRIEPVDLVEKFGPARERGGPLEQRHYDIARSLQETLEETVCGMARWLRKASGAPNLVLAGGVALNCVMNARLDALGIYDDIWVQPAAGDAGTALGAALWLDYAERGNRDRRWEMTHAYLGPAYCDDEIEAFLRRARLPYRRVDDVAREAARLLAGDRIIGWFQGGMEFGPRALGARSILASPIHAQMQERLNELKDREDFRPVAPVVLESKAHEWFDARGHVPLRAPFMLFVYDVLPHAAERIPAVRHVDGTARVQTVRRDQNPRYHDLLVAFEDLTGIPVLVNTSFNTRGEPIVCTPRDAIECFWTSPLDALSIGSFFLYKEGVE